jgi:hypothetical protein
MTALKKDKGSSLLCSAWIHGPNCRKEEVSHAIVGKSVGNAGSSHGVLEISRYDLKEDLVSESVSGLPTTQLVQPFCCGKPCLLWHIFVLYGFFFGLICFDTKRVFADIMSICSILRLKVFNGIGFRDEIVIFDLASGWNLHGYQILHD